MSKCKDPGCRWNLGGTIHTDACYDELMREYNSYEAYKQEEENDRFADMTPILL